MKAGLSRSHYIHPTRFRVKARVRELKDIEQHHTQSESTPIGEQTVILTPLYIYKLLN